VTSKTSTIPIEVRVNALGEFSAQYPIGNWYKADTVNDLRDAITKAVVAEETIGWTRHIQIAYRTQLENGDGIYRHRNRNDRDLEDRIDGKERREISGLSCAFCVFDVSTGNRPAVRELHNYADEGRRLIDFDHDAGDGWAYDDGDEHGNRGLHGDPREGGLVLPYSHEVYRALLAIRAGIIEIDRRMRDLLVGGREEVRARLTQVAIAQPGTLLPAPRDQPWNTCPSCGELVDPPNGEHFTDSESFQHLECDTWLIVVQEGDGLALAVTDEPEEPEPDDDETDDEAAPRTARFTVDPDAIPELIARGLAHPVTDAHADARAALDQHVAECTDCVRFADEAEPIEFCEVGTALLDATAAHEESRLGVQALGEDL